MIEVSIRMSAEHLEKSVFPIELAFYNVDDFLRMGINELVNKIETLRLKISSIHAPQFKILDKNLMKIWIILKSLCDKLNVNYVVMHPSFGKLDSFVYEKFNLISGIMQESNVCIEKFGSKKRIVSTLESYKEVKSHYSNFYCCFDFSHTRGDEAEIEPYLSFTPIIHVSNTVGELQHQRLFDKNGRLDYTEVIKILQKHNWNGVLVIEYLLEHHSHLIEDAQRLEKIIYGEKGA